MDGNTYYRADSGAPHARGGLRPPTTPGDYDTDGPDCQRFPIEYRYSEWDGVPISQSYPITDNVRHGGSSQWKKSLPQ